MRQADFNVLVLQAALIAYLIWWFRAPLKRWALARYRIAIEAYREAQEKRRQAEEKKECKDDVAVQKEGKEAKAAVVDEGKKQQAARQRRRPAAKLQDLNAKELLEVVAPASSTSSEVDLHAPDEDEATPHDSHQGDGEDRPKGSLLSRTSEVSIMHELRPGKGDEAVLAAVQLAFSELCSCNLWSTCKQHRLKVSSCVRWTGSDWEAVGILLYRLEPHLLQVVFLGVLPAYRRQHVGRALVKALRELARRDPNCMSIMAVVPEHAEAVHFFKAAGFKRSEPGGEHQVMRIDLRRLKSQKKQLEELSSDSGSGRHLLLWEQVVAQARCQSPKAQKEKVASSRAEKAEPEAAAGKPEAESEAKVPSDHHEARAQEEASGEEAVQDPPTLTHPADPTLAEEVAEDRSNGDRDEPVALSAEEPQEAEASREGRDAEDIPRGSQASRTSSREDAEVPPPSQARSKAARKDPSWMPTLRHLQPAAKMPLSYKQ
ncbi:unnamed protein product [Effrenium voratum]|uniref:N-acetyltransferase domain-containing protein n=1 Tax=Effrenium voratum TaxID=2562239 RepID=A0AA36JNH8_9DINO|nr:unnamed protein product [Effrenium voratum]CAJ1432827.1 unnamed protein product [Effrenium voratum]